MVIRSAWWRNPGHRLTKVVLFVVAPMLAGGLTVFQLRGWGQLSQGGVWGWLVVALAGFALGGLVALAQRRLTEARALLFTATALVAFLVGIAVGSAAFDEFAALGGLELEVEGPAEAVSLGEWSAIDITVRNTSRQAFADVTLHGVASDTCIDADIEDVTSSLALVEPGQARTVTCGFVASTELAGSVISAEGVATEPDLVDDSTATALVDLELAGLTAVLSGPRAGPDDSTAAPDVITPSDQPVTLAWSLTNVGASAVEPSIRLTSDVPLDPDQAVCTSTPSRLEAGAQGVVECTVADPVTTRVWPVDAGRTPVESRPVWLTALDPGTDPTEPGDGGEVLVVDRQVATFPDSGQFADEGYWASESFRADGVYGGDPQVRIQVVNRSDSPLEVAVSDTVPDCEREAVVVDPDEPFAYTCVGTAGDSSSTASTFEDGSTVRASMGGVDVTATDATTLYPNGPPHPTLPLTDGPTARLVRGVADQVDRYFVPVMLLVTALGLVLVWFDHVLGSPTAPMPAAESPSPGWRPDPFGRHGHRWWDGGAWTDRVFDEASDPPGDEAG
ncbi:MAG: DUF2510 domain-containing protein [Acidimicrobiales bacterium]|nr:DUF2510 domain-containing protein [Acidimicrobiales bacterium]